MDSATRYLAMFDELCQRKRWGTDKNLLRFVALTLAWADVVDAGARLETAADEIKSRSGWTSPLRSPIRYVIAAMLLSRGLSPASVLERVEQVRAEFRRRGMKRGGTHEAFAALLLVLSDGAAPVPAEKVGRLEAILESWKRDHPFLTGADDYPMAALHATREKSVEKLSADVEEIYEALRGASYRRSNVLQMASHVLVMAEGTPRQAASRFDELVRGFQQRERKVSPREYDEVALLALCSGAPSALARRVLDIEQHLRGTKPRPSKEVAFSLAVGIVLSEDAQQRRELGSTRDVAAARMVQAVLDAQQAAVMAAVSASVAASVAASASSG